ncbi:hypothetical protein CC79DRAFT_1324291 [Sarocladium strictum]
MAIKTLISALAVATLCDSVLAVPAATTNTNNVLSIRAANMVTADYSDHADHPAFGLYERWLATNPHAGIFRRNATEAVEKHPNFEGVECDVSKDTCFLTSRMSISDEAVAELNWQHKQNNRLGRRDWPFGTVENLITELHYKTYHFLENEDGDEEYAGFESYHEWDLHCQTILLRSSGGQIMANHNIDVSDYNHYTGSLTTTITWEHGPLHEEEFVAVFTCYLFSGQCCDHGGYERLLIAGEEHVWPTKPEKTCNYGKTKTGDC